MSNSIEKYSFGAKTDNEGKIIVGILSKFFTNRLEFIGEGNTSYHISGGEMHCSFFQRDSLDIDDLLAMAKRGFKEPWEVAPDGYRLVTEEERKNNPWPKDAVSCPEWDDKWGDRDQEHCWDSPDCFGGESDPVYYAVPLDFTFEPVVIEISPTEAHDILEKHLGGKVKVTK